MRCMYYFRDMVWPILWESDEFKSGLIALVIMPISYKIMGNIMFRGREVDIWFGKRGGKILYYLVSTSIVWLIIKMIP